LLFFLTPICYSEDALPREAAVLLLKNPLNTLVRAYRDILIENQLPTVQTLGKLWLLGALSFWGGYAIFAKLRKGFADVV
jgi:ABC-type polysaccharide/polyol phosphate export permease